MTTKLGILLKKSRLNKKYTLNDVSKKAKISATYLSEIERGFKIPSMQIVANLSVALNFIVPKALECIKDDLYNKWGKL